MSDINLLQNQLIADSDVKLQRTLSRLEMALVIIFVLGVLTGGGLFAWKTLTSRASVRDAEIVEQRNQELALSAGEKREKVVRFQSQTVNMGLLLEEHRYWTNVLRLINSAAIFGVQFLEVNGTNEGNVVIGGLATELPTIAAFTKNLNSLPYVKQVVLNSSSLSDIPNSTFYRFTITVVFDPEVLKFQDPEALSVNPPQAYSSEAH